MMQIIPQQPFDRELGINDLLDVLDRKKLEKALFQLLGGSMQLRDTGGNTLLGSGSGKASEQVPLVVQLEPVAYLAGDDPATIDAAAGFLEQLLKTAERYLMAADLHLEAVHADYESLQAKHEALQESEARYRALASNLEQQVDEQVRTIESTQRQLYQAEKLASVGQLAAGVAHEINNPIGFIRSNLATAETYVENLKRFAEKLKQATDSGTVAEAWKDADLDYIMEDFSTLIRESTEGADRVTRIVTDLKDFSNVDRNEEEVADINQVIESVGNVLKSQLPNGVSLALSLGTIPATRCRPGHLAQVFLNILLNGSNAVDKNKGVLEVSTSSEDETLVIQLRDNGCGMSADTLTRIFDPFFTTHDVGGGTGLGLTVSRDIVVTHGGDIRVESIPAQGTKFTVTLPVRS